jgi:TolB-like protein/cytochrome c-type biogenesis protein CcmH/NrfG
MREVWQGRVVTDDSLVQCLVDIRRALSGIDREVVLTRPNRGYLLQSDKVALSKQSPVKRVFQHRILATAALAVIAIVTTFALRTQDEAPSLIEPLLSPSIAVLPFVDLTEQQDKRFLAEGLADEILNRLAATDGLKVISRTSSFSLGNDNTDIRAIAEKLSVSHVLEGSVRQGDDRLRISVQLIDTADSSHLWSETYDRPFGDILDVQLDIARSVANALNTTLQKNAALDEGTNPYAHALVIQAKALLQLRDKESSEHAARLLQDALEINPNSVTALSVLARAVRQSAPPRDSAEYHAAWLHSIELTNQALRKDPNHPYAVAQLGWIELYYYKDYAAAARSIERAVSLDPTHPEVLRLTINALLVYGQPSRSIELSHYVIDQDPLCVSCLGFLSMTAGSAGDVALAESTIRRMLELDPTNAFAAEFLGDVLLSKGNPSAALMQFEQIGNVDRADILLARAVAHYQLEEMEQFARLRKRLIELHGETRPSYVARLEAYAGNIDEAFAWLDKQLAKPSWSRLVNYRSSYYANLHGDPRWNDYLTEYGVSPAQIAAIDFRPPLPF